MKKFIAVFLTIVLSVSLAACGDNNKPNMSNETDNSSSQSSENNNNPSTNAKYTNNFEFMGYQVAYPDDAEKDWIDHGFIIGTNDYAVVIETPSTIGEVVTVSNIEEAPVITEEQLIRTLEHKVRSNFDFGTTERIVKSSKKVTNNDVEMLKVNGEFHNSETDKIYEFTSYYLLAGDQNNEPLYIVGVPMTDGFDVETLVDQIAKNIKK